MVLESSVLASIETQEKPSKNKVIWSFSTVYEDSSLSGNKAVPGDTGLRKKMIWRGYQERNI